MLASITEIKTMIPIHGERLTDLRRFAPDAGGRSGVYKCLRFRYALPRVSLIAIAVAPLITLVRVLDVDACL